MWPTFNVHILAQQNLHFIGRHHTDINDWHWHQASLIGQCRMPDLDVRVIAVFCCAHNSAARLNQVPQNLLNIRIFSNIILTEELEPAAGFWWTSGWKYEQQICVVRHRKGPILKVPRTSRQNPAA